MHFSSSGLSLILLLSPSARCWRQLHGLISLCHTTSRWKPSLDTSCVNWLKLIQSPLNLHNLFVHNKWARNVAKTWTDVVSMINAWLSRECVRGIWSSVARLETEYRETRQLNRSRSQRWRAWSKSESLTNNFANPGLVCDRANTLAETVLIVSKSTWSHVASRSLCLSTQNNRSSRKPCN